jgi:hypothetical protein
MRKKLFLKLNVNFIVFVIIQLCFSQVALAQKFVIPVLPDTQYEVNYNLPMFTKQLQWIADKKDSLNIPIVLHAGDLVDFNNIDQFIRASEGFKILDRSKISYAITVGNHDTEAVGEQSGSAAPGNVNQNLRKTTKFNTYFPVKRFTAQKGRFEEYKSDNAYYTFKAGGLKWLVITLEYRPRQAPLTWACNIIPKYPKYNVIVLTHYFLNGAIIGMDNSEYGDLNPKVIFDQLIRPNANVRLILSGHCGSSDYREDTGVNGNPIYEIVQDYQEQDNGGGYIRLLEIDPSKGTLSAKMYSPFYKITKDDKSQFSFSGVSFVGSKSGNSKNHKTE